MAQLDPNSGKASEGNYGEMESGNMENLNGENNFSTEENINQIEKANDEFNFKINTKEGTLNSEHSKQKPQEIKMENLEYKYAPINFTNNNIHQGNYFNPHDYNNYNLFDYNDQSNYDLYYQSLYQMYPQMSDVIIYLKNLFKT